MKKIALLAFAALLLPGAALADESFDNFRNFCVTNRSAAAPALAAADAAGWSPVPQNLLSQLPQFQGADGRIHQTANGGQLLVTALSTTAEMGSVRVCAVAVVPAGISDLAGQLQAFAGVPKQSAPSLPEGMYAWRDQNGARVSLDHEAPDFRAQIASGTALVATTNSTPQMTMILLMSAAP